MEMGTRLKYVPMHGERDFTLSHNRSNLVKLDRIPSLAAFQEKANSALRHKNFKNLLLSDLRLQKAKPPYELFRVSEDFEVAGRVASVLGRGHRIIDVGLETDFEEVLLVAVSLNGELYKELNIRMPITVFQNSHGEERFLIDGQITELPIESVKIAETEERGIIDRRLTIACNRFGGGQGIVEVTIGGPDIVGFILYHTEPEEGQSDDRPISHNFAVEWPLKHDRGQAVERVQDVIEGIAHFRKKVEAEWASHEDYV